MKIFICLTEFCFLLSGRWEVGLWDWGLCNLWRDEVSLCFVWSCHLFFLSHLCWALQLYTTKVSLNGKNLNCLYLFSLLHLTLHALGCKVEKFFCWQCLHRHCVHILIIRNPQGPLWGGNLRGSSTYNMHPYPGIFHWKWLSSWCWLLLSTFEDL